MVWLEIYLWGAMVNLLFTGPALAQALGHSSLESGWRFWIGVWAFWIVGALSWPVLMPIIAIHLQSRGY